MEKGGCLPLVSLGQTLLSSWRKMIVPLGEFTTFLVTQGGE